MRIGLISDTHTMHDMLNIPEGLDMIIHAGDGSDDREPYMNEPQARMFAQWFDSLYVKHKIRVDGNHDTASGVGLFNPYEFALDSHYLKNDSVEIEGLKIWGSPTSPTFGYGWAYNLDSLDRWKLCDSIPLDTDIFIIHGPPQGFGDRVNNGSSVGCYHLMEAIHRIKPKLVVSGHIHEDSGIRTVTHDDGTETLVINASSINDSYDGMKEVIVIEL